MKKQKKSENRHLLVNFLVTPSEKRTLKALARARGVTMSELLRAHVRALACQQQQEKVT